MREVPSASARALFAGLVDYAGLFPPAALGMGEAVAAYDRYRRGPEGWMLGRFVVPASGLGELEQAATSMWSGRLAPGAGETATWLVSLLLGGDAVADLRAARSFNERHAGRAMADTVEAKAATCAQVEAVLTAAPGPSVFVELPLTGDLDGLLAALRAKGGRAKIRTGGLTPDAIPSTAQVALFLEASARAGVPFKATAGLHHPVRAERALTYAPDSPRGVMHGFLNVFVAAAFARRGAGAARLEAVLREEKAAAFVFDEAGLAWRGERVSTGELAETRRAFACAFGSCSFTEPVEDLRELGLIP